MQNVRGGYFYDEEQAFRAAVSESLAEVRREKRNRRLDTPHQALPPGWYTLVLVGLNALHCIAESNSSS